MACPLCLRDEGHCGGVPSSGIFEPMNRYYSDGTCGMFPGDVAKTRLPRHVLEHHGREEFVMLVEKLLGSAVAKQARALLMERASCESQNTNALHALSRLAQDRGEWTLALELGGYFDRRVY